MKKTKRKKGMIIIGIILLVFVVCILGFNIFIKAMDGKEITRGDYVVSVSSKWKNVTIVRYNGDDEIVSIPEKIMMLPVVAIDESAFRDNKQIRKVVFPTTLRTIKANAFNNCTALEDVEINGELYWIYEYAFFNCCSIKELNIPYSHELIVDKSAFESCTGLESVNLNDGKVSLGTYAFYDCEKLKTVQGVDGGIEVASDAFDNTAFLNNHDGDFFVLGSYLWKYCGNDTDITIPESITRIAPMAFADKNIESIHMPSVFSTFSFEFTQDDSTLENKVKIYYGNVDEFDVQDFSYSGLKKNVILVAPMHSAVIAYAKENGIEYIIE